MPHNRYLPNDLSDDARLRAFAFPSAGGGAAAYFRMRRQIPTPIDLVPVLLPGREGRIADSPRDDMRALVTEIADAIAPLDARPFALVGHSMGAWIAFELARELRRRGEPLPCALVAIASPAPQRRQTDTPIHALRDDDLVAEISRRFGGIPPAVQANQELMQLLLPALRADMRLVETYEYIEEPPLATDVIALGGADDRAVSATAIGEWRQQTSQAFTNRLWPGGHFFLFPPDQQAATVLPPAMKWIATRLQKYAES
jgi:medium-chain acyl-[acyl-carrier-protein] hydrolase